MIQPISRTATYTPASTPKSIIARAQTELISPQKFYRLCQQFRRETGQSRLYFGEPIAAYLDCGLSAAEIRQLFDDLALYVKLTPTPNAIAHFNLKFPGYPRKRAITITVEIIGSGMIGRVAKVTLNGGDAIAFKVFFDPDFVWLHGPWGEIPVGIRLKYCQVTKDISEFLFASESWAVWEWIDPQTSMRSRRRGITYAAFAHREGLTRLNPLNRKNYNPYGIRLDPGGIQKEYPGRRLFDCYWGTLFYLRKIRREGWHGIQEVIDLHLFLYGMKRLFALFFPTIATAQVVRTSENPEIGFRMGS